MESEAPPDRKEDERRLGERGCGSDATELRPRQRLAQAGGRPHWL